MMNAKISVRSDAGNLYAVPMISLALAALLTSSVAWANTCTWKSSGRVNDWNWTESGNFEGNLRPQAGDTVIVPDATTVYVKSSDAASTNVLAGLARVKTMTATSRVVFNAESAADVITVTCPVTYETGDEVAYSSRGEIVKDGPGHVFLSSVESRGDYNLKITINAGSLRLPYTPNAFGRLYFGQIYIAEGATLFTCTANTQGYGYTQALGYSGSGLITNDSKVCNWIRTREGDGESTFYGKIDGNVKLAGGARVMLMGEDSRFGEPVWECGLWNMKANSLTANVLGVKKFGNAGEPSSIGRGDTIYSVSGSDSFGRGGGYLYLGSGEKTTKNWYVYHGLILLGGGPFGGLELAGQLDWAQCPVFLIDGTNANPCIISGHFGNGSTTGRYPYFYKRGTGAWRFLCDASASSFRLVSPGFAVEEGSLQFSSLRPANEVSALGRSLVKRRGGMLNSMEVPDEELVDYTFLLGATNAQGVITTEGTLEPVSGRLGGVSNSFWTTDRPIALCGHGRLLMNRIDNGTGVERRLTMRGVKSVAPGAHVLTLDGTGSNTNTIADIVDGDVGTVSVVKKGSGLWVLAGTNTFSGELRVDEGTLEVNSSRDYSWYRLVVTRLNGGAQLQVRQLALFDAAGDNQVVGLTNASGYDHTVLAPGTVADGRASVKTWAPNRLNQMFSSDYTSFIDKMLRFKMYSNDGSTWRITDTSNGAPDPTKPDTWYWVDFRLPAAAHAVTSYDMIAPLDNIDPDTAQSANGDDKFKNSIRGWQLLGSVDGIHWDKLHEIADAADTTGEMHYAPAGCTNYWMATQKKAVAKETGHLDGIAIARGPSTTFSQLENATVSVAKGATLAAQGARLTINRFVVSANGVGTLRNFAFANSGTLEFTGVDRSASQIRIPGTYENVTGLASLANWSVSGAGNMQLTVEGDVLVLTKRGMVLILR